MVVPPRAPGRPRSEHADRAIVAATLELLAEDGFDALSVEAVASRAGVGKATIYRRFTCRDQLVAESLATLNDDLPPIPHGETVRETMTAALDQLAARGTATPAGRIMSQVVSQAAANPDLVRTYYDRVVAPRRERLAAVLRAGVASGELRGDLDVEQAISLLVGPVLYRSWWAAAGSGPPPVPADVIVAAVWPWLAAG